MYNVEQVNKILRFIIDHIPHSRMAQDKIDKGKIYLEIDNQIFTIRVGQLKEQIADWDYVKHRYGH